jgi:sigma-B regulation protein RsbU (phosphoserine phosphatase)
MNPTESKLENALSIEVLATLAEIGEKINASLDLDEVLSNAAALIKRLIEYEIFAVLLLDDSDRQLYFHFAIGHKPEVVEKVRIPLGQGVTGRAAASGQAVLVRDVREETNYINVLESVRSELAAPLLWKGRCIGVLDIQSQHVDYFKPEQQNILTLLASRLAIAIENARLFEKTKAQTDTLLLLHEVARDAGAILDLEEQLRRAAELAKRVIDYQIFSILLYDEKSNVFRHRITVKFEEKIQEKFAVPATEGIVGAAAMTKQPVLAPDVTADPRYLPVNPETRSELAIPMIHKGRVVGVLDLESPQLNYFNEDHVRTLSILAAHLAVSLENARLYQQVARDEARMERDLQAARRMQGALLPPLPKEDFGLEIATRYVSAREVGGDLYDFLRYGPQQLGIALGDVSGKGTAAALYGAVGIGILRSLAPLKLPPAEMLRRLNQVVCESKIEGRFMTLCFATWHRGRQKLRIANAGQSQPLLYKPSGCEKLKVAGFPLGIFDEVAYEEWSTTLDAGDIVVLYSDGLAESMNPSGDQFGVERLQSLLCSNAALSANDLAELIFKEVARFAQGAPAFDDRTLVILKATTPPAPEEKGS